MSGLDSDWVANAEIRHKRRREDDSLDDDDHSYGFPGETVKVVKREQTTPTNKVPKLKLSLKLGSAHNHTEPQKQQQQQLTLPLSSSMPSVVAATASTATAESETIRYAYDHDSTDRYSDDELVDIGGAEHYSTHSDRQSQGVPVERRPSSRSSTQHLPPTQTLSPVKQESGSGSSTPRIRLRFSLKKEPVSAKQEEPTQMTSVDRREQKPSPPPRMSQLQIRNTWHDDYSSRSHHQPSPLATGFSSTMPGSPTESVMSNASSGYNVRYLDRAGSLHTGQTTYSPSIASDADSDDNRIDYLVSDADGSTYEARTPLRASPSQADAAPRRRGRPPLRGRRSTNSARVGARPSTTPRQLSGASTTSVTLKSSLVRLITRIRKRDSYGFFMEPVNTNVITDYLGVIKKPMDLGTIQRKVNRGTYSGIAEFREDVMLVCENARKYNGVGSIYARSADHVQAYATAAIDRETAKLERVGRATVPVQSVASYDSGSLYGSPRSYAQSRSRSPSSSVSPHHDSVADEYSDSRMGGEHRRSSRLRWRGASESHQQQNQHQPLVDATPASIVDNFKWSGSRKKYKRASAVPKRITESLVKVALLADGSIDPAAFEDDVALVPYDRAHIDAPLVVSTASAANSTFAHGRYFAPATFGDYGPSVSLGRGATGNDIGGLGGNLQTVHGDIMGLAYWSSISSFIDGAGSDVTHYASTVMDHLTGGGFDVASKTLEYLSSRDAGTSESGEAVIDGQLGSVHIRGLSEWLDEQRVRDQLYAERVNALAKQLSLQDISSRCAADQRSSTRPERMSESQKLQMFAQNNQKLKELHEMQLQGRSDDIGADDLESLETSIYGLSEQICLALTKSCLPATQVPALRRPLTVRSHQQDTHTTSPATKIIPRSLIRAAARPFNAAGSGTGGTPTPPLPPTAPGIASQLIPPRQNRTVSTPALPTRFGNKLNQDN
ncbi:hypothetical protein EV175_003020 [Coemansia sp. RSA 1933]|nr:hypothetical protein EV175_003020 [Coemansia sp. RSA 1933]